MTGFSNRRFFTTFASLLTASGGTAALVILLWLF
jgi:hypothetical protein